MEDDRGDPTRHGLLICNPEANAGVHAAACYEAPALEQAGAVKAKSD